MVASSRVNIEEVVVVWRQGARAVTQVKEKAESMMSLGGARHRRAMTNAQNAATTTTAERQLRPNVRGVLSDGDGASAVGAGVFRASSHLRRGLGRLS